MGSEGQATPPSGSPSLLDSGSENGVGGGPAEAHAKSIPYGQVQLVSLRRWNA